MKKRLFILLSLLVVGVLSVFTACGETPPPKPAELTHIAAVAATCTADGNVEYWSDGTNYYGDAAGTESLTSSAIKVPALGHGYGAPEWTWDEDNTAATAKFVCARGDDTQILNAEITSASSATCEEAGALKYTATVVLDGVSYASDNEVPAPALGHGYGAPEWTWAADNSAATAKFVCVNCHDEHKITVDAVYDAVASTVTCKADGEMAYKAEVTFNGTSYEDTKTVAASALGHAYGEPEWTWAADNTAKAKFTCTRGDDTQTVTANVTSQVTAEADCVRAGSTKYTATVTFGTRAYTNEKTVATAATGHAYGDPAWTWESDYSAAKATLTCEKNDDTKVLPAEIKLGSTSTASCTAAGEAVYNATVTLNGRDYTDTKTATTEALGHDYEVDWIWNEDLSSATANYSCTRGDDTGEMTDSEIEKTETPATCALEGSIVYTASVTIGGKIFTDTKTTPLPKLDHNNADGTYIADGDAGHHYVCSLCGQNVSSAHEYVSAYKAPESGEGNGTFHKKCDICGYDGADLGQPFGDRSVTVNGVKISTPYACYSEENVSKGITYDMLNGAIDATFVINLNANTIGQYAESGLTINGENNEVVVNVETDVTLPSLIFTNGFRKLTIVGKGTLTITGEFRSDANPTTIRGNVNFGGNVITGDQQLVIESGDVAVSNNGVMTSYNLKVGTTDGSTSPTLTISVSGNREGLKSTGFNKLNLQLLSGTTVIKNDKKESCGISCNQAGDVITVGANATFNVQGFQFGIAAWDAAANKVKFIVDGKYNFIDCTTELKDVTPVHSEA